jgi:hypothetical protein
MKERITLESKILEGKVKDKLIKKLQLENSKKSEIEKKFSNSHLKIIF